MILYSHKDLDRLIEYMRRENLLCIHTAYGAGLSSEQRLHAIFKNEVPYPYDSAKELWEFTQEPIEEMPPCLTHGWLAKRAIATWRLEIGK